jgi:hypothetical protein
LIRLLMHYRLGKWEMPGMKNNIIWRPGRHMARYRLKVSRNLI